MPNPAAYAPGGNLGNKFASGKHRVLRHTRSAAATSALETCRTGGMDPIRIQVDAMRSMYGVAASIQRLYPDAFQDPLGESKDTAGRIIKNQTIIKAFTQALRDASMIACGVAEFAYPKYSRIHHVGDVPTTGPINQKVVVTLNLGGAPAVREAAEADDGVTIENEESI